MSITIAVPKGRLGNDLIRQLQKSGIGSSIDLKSRKLIFRDEENDMEFVFLKNSDVITYVENGIRSGRPASVTCRINKAN